jgi:hypothetical protein
MQTRTLTQAEWADYFAELTEYDEDLIVTVEQMVDGQSQTLGRDQTLQGVTWIEKGSEAGNIEIALGTSPSSHLSHEVPGARTVEVEENEDGSPAVLRIQGQDGTTTLFFRPLDDSGLTFGETELDEDEPLAV